jgi:hypothetical protein
LMRKSMSVEQVQKRVGSRKSWCVSVPRQMSKAMVDVGMDNSVAMTTSEPNYDSN